MAEDRSAPTLFTSRWPKALQPLASRPHLLAAAAVGVAFYALAGPWLARDVTRGLAAWDLAAATFVVLSLMSMADSRFERMKARAIASDEGRHVTLALSTFAAAASVAAIVAELGVAKSRGQLGEAFSVGLAAGTIALSWFFVHLVFAIHYAHVYYVAAEAADIDKGGLDFPDDDAPDYWDFLYFAVIIGATAQTADVNIRAKEIRRIATVHCLIAFAFNTAILATMINLAAGLF